MKINEERVGKVLTETEFQEVFGVPARPRLLDPGLSLTLRPMRYPQYYGMYRDAIKNTWTVEEVDFNPDVQDLRDKLTDGERHLVHRLVAFFATGDSIVSNNLVLNLYKHINAPEARMYLSRQLYEEALHVQFYLTLLDTYVTDPEARADAFKAVDTIPSIKAKADFCMHHLESAALLDRLESREQRREFLYNLATFACAVEGLFFYAAFAYVYFLRSRGLCQGLASGTSWVFRDETCHMQFAFDVFKTAKSEEPDLVDTAFESRVRLMLVEAIACEMQFAEDLLSQGVVGLSLDDMRTYLEYVADQRLVALGMTPVYGVKNPFGFMELQDTQELANFFERRSTAYQVGVTGEVAFDEKF